MRRLEVIADGRFLVIDLGKAHMALIHHRGFGIAAAAAASRLFLQADLVLVGQVAAQLLKRARGIVTLLALKAIAVIPGRCSGCQGGRHNCRRRLLL